VKEVLELFREYNYKSDLVFYNTLLFMFGRGGHYADAWRILADMKEAGFAPTLETYNSLILVFGRGSIQQGLQVFADMIASNMDVSLLQSLICSFFFLCYRSVEIYHFLIIDKIHLFPGSC
jgi:pentatricopeptide repeat protein